MVEFLLAGKVISLVRLNFSTQTQTEMNIINCTSVKEMMRSASYAAPEYCTDVRRLKNGVSISGTHSECY